MAFLRGFMGAKQIMRRSVSDSSSTPKGFMAVYVGRNLKKRYLVPVSYLNEPSFQALLRKSEEEFGFDHPMGGLTIPCDESLFFTVTSRIR
ncbi:PREDICTED: auxin-responsive protein SAUR15 [Tarenaya hassleriana]|uniref:auxin-responsive protein SAUR15 n=1 Tax=Tarenaya hassleriana TaxID=28532 RepID=UPI00053C1C16|nr:PREDICTED: auxin-responsive protein SAUR15 [Tarenaya hassleriana]